MIHNDNEALKLLQNQKAEVAVMTFLSANQNPQEFAGVATPILEVLSSSHAEQDVGELVDALKIEGQIPDGDREAYAEALEHMANLALVEKNNDMLIQNAALPLLLVRLKRELDPSVETLAKKGILEVHDRTLTALLSTLEKLREVANKEKEGGVDGELVEQGLIECCTKLVNSRPDFKRPVSYTLGAMVSLLTD